jgi:amino-acid N-acetyltransferase
MSISAQPCIRSGRPADLPAALRLLQASGLPTADLTSTEALRLWVLEIRDSVEGVIALQRFGEDALLRSLAVAPEHRQRGYGRELVARLETNARADGVRTLVLLTETAHRFFQSLGYETVERQVASEEMRQCAEFRALCPASAMCMSKTLTAPAVTEPT